MFCLQLSVTRLVLVPSPLGTSSAQFALTQIKVGFVAICFFNLSWRATEPLALPIPLPFSGLCLFSPGLACLFPALLSWALGLPASGHVQVPLHTNETGSSHHILLGSQSVCGPWGRWSIWRSPELSLLSLPRPPQWGHSPGGVCVLAGLKALVSVPHH